MASSLVEDALTCVKDALPRLLAVWDNIGMEAQDRDERAGEVLGHLTTLLESMAHQEEHAQQEIVENISKYEHQVTALATELHMDYKMPPESASLLKREEQLEDLVDQLTIEKERRLESLVELETRLESLQTSLVSNSTTMIEGEADDKDDISLGRIEKLRHQVEACEEELRQRRESLAFMVEEIKAFWKTLGVEPQSELEKSIAQGLENMTLSPATMEELADMHKQLLESKERLCKDIENLQRRIGGLWDVLEVPEDERQSVFETTAGYNIDTYRMLQEEFRRLQSMREANVDVFIQKCREDMESVWNACFLSERQRQESEFYDVEEAEPSLELLSAMEEEVFTLEARRDADRHLYDLVAEREDVIKRLENKVDLASRLNNRGGVLLKEQKMRRELHKRLADLDEQLLQDLEAWRQDNGKPFVVYEEDYAQVITSRQAREKEKRELKRLHKLKMKQIKQHDEEAALEENKMAPFTPKKKPVVDMTPKSRRTATAAKSARSKSRRKALGDTNGAGVSSQDGTAASRSGRSLRSARQVGNELARAAKDDSGKSRHIYGDNTLLMATKNGIQVEMDNSAAHTLELSVSPEAFKKEIASRMRSSFLPSEH